jgi:hypothetical protein
MAIKDRVLHMPSTLSARRKPPRTPPGCEGHLTRQQAAELLGFSSEFKIRQLEREGRLRSVRGPMRTAFYARADVLVVKAELEQEAPGRGADEDWTDAELLLLLRHPNREGRTRTALDLVLETQISIDRAEKVCAFWASCGGTGPVAPAAAKPLGPDQQSDVATKATVAALRGAPEATVPSHPAAPAPEPEVPRRRTEASPEPAVQQREPARPREPKPEATIPSPQAATAPEEVRADAAYERRGEERLSRDALIAELRHPDPRVRDRAFARLREQSSD